MFDSNEILNHFKYQVEILIEHLTKLTYSEQCEGIKFIRKCLLKISKRKNTDYSYSLRQRPPSGTEDSKPRSEEGNGQRNEKEFISKSNVTSISSNTHLASKALYQTSDQDDIKPEIHENSNFERDSICEDNKAIVKNGEHISSNDENNEKKNTAEFETNCNDNSSEFVKNEIKLIEDCSESKRDIQTCNGKKAKCSNTKRKFSCVICTRNLPNMIDLIKHILKHDCAPSSCLKCKAIFQNRISFNYHVTVDDCSESIDPKGVYFLPDVQKWNKDDAISKMVLLGCPYCGIRCGKMHNLKRHLKESCIGVRRKYQCSLCDQSFVSENLFETHKAKHEKFQCTKCDLSFCTRSLLREHRKIHGMKCKKPNTYLCQQCKITFKGRTLYREHGEICKRFDSYPDPVWCKECSMMFRDRYTYKRHCIRKKHTITNQDTTVEKPFVCEKCGTAFANCYGLSTHCTRMHQQKAIVFSCDQCPYTTTRMTNLVRHKNCRHGGEIKKYVCDQCPATLSSSTHLRTHCETVHSEVKNFPCDICWKPFKVQTQLNRHRLTHSAVMPHKCPHCPKSFLRAGILQRHIHSKHDEHIPKDHLAISVMKFNKNSRKKPSCANKTMEHPLEVNAEVPTMHRPKDQIFSLIDVQSGELVTLSVTEMSNNAVINMSDGDLLNGIHMPDLWTNPTGLFSLDPMMQDTETSAYGMLADGGPQISQDLLKTLHGQLSKDAMGHYMPQYLEIDESHKDMTDNCLMTEDYGMKPNILTQSILTSDNMIITMPNPQ